MNRWLLLAVAASVGLSACSKKQETAAPAAAPQAAAPAAPAAMAATPNTGKVMQLMQGGGYTYAEVETGNGEKVWLAGGQIEVKAGDTVQWGDAAVMTNFASKSLGRSFDRILFVNAWGPVGAAVTGVAPHGTAPGQHPPMQQGMGQGMQQAAPQATVPANVGEVKSVINGGGYTYLEVLKGGATVWVAAPETAVKAGDTVSWSDGMVMTNFTSSSLNRKFDQIVFASAVKVGK